MTRTAIVVSCFLAALVSGGVLLAISAATVVPLVASGSGPGGSGPGGVQVTGGGWLALVLSILGTGGFTLAGVVAAVAGRLGVHLPTNQSDALIPEIMELTSSFAALMRDKTNRASQRRFVFALVDAARMINGCETSHEAGVVVLRYSGYADPSASAITGVAI